MGVTWTVSLLLVFFFTLPAVMSVGNSLSTNCTATENCKDYQLTADESAGSRLNSTGLKEYIKWFQDPSMASVKSIFNIDRIRESSRTSLFWFSSAFQYFRSVGCYMMEFYEKLKSISSRFVANFKFFCMDLPASMMHVAAKIQRFCKYFDSESVIDSYPRNARAENHGKNVSKFENPASRAPLILGMFICPTEEESVPAAIQQHDAIDLIKEPDSYYTHVKTPYNSVSEGPIIELNPHEFWWLIWASLFVVAALILILLILKALIPRNKFLSDSQTSKNKLNKPGWDHITKSMEEQKWIASYSGEISKTTTESTVESDESPRFGSFIDYVEIPVSREGSGNKEVKTTPVRRSVRIRNKALFPLRPAPSFTSPWQ